MFKKYGVILLNLTIALANFWIWKVIKGDVFLGLLLISLSLAVTYLTNIKFGIRVFLIFLFLSLAIGSQTLISGFDQGLKMISFDQEKQLGERHGYFSIDFGKLFQNKFALRFYKDINPYLNVYQSNVFNSLSLNLYFFANHPRERAKVREFPMYPAIFVVPFFIGLIYCISRPNYLLTGYLTFALLITGFVRQDYIYGPILMMPLINMLITLGLKNVYIYLRKNEI